MKVLIFGLALFVSVQALASSECPSLRGKYICGDSDILTIPTTLTIKETEQNGVSMYKILNRPIIADGVMRSEKVTLRDGEVVTRNILNKCEAQKLLINIVTNDSNDTTRLAVENVEYSVDPWGDLVVVQETTYSDGETSKSVTNCERQ